MAETKDYLTKEKFNELAKELDFLRNTKRKEVAEELEYAKQLGDLAENAEYHQAREEQAMLEDRINKLDGLLKGALIINSEKSGHRTDQVTVGSTVELRAEGKKESVSYTLVGTEEANSTLGKISSSSPLGQGLLGKKKGDAAVVTTPRGAVTYTVIKIS